MDLYSSCLRVSPMPASACALGVRPRIMLATFRSSMTRALYFLVSLVGHLVNGVLPESLYAAVALVYPALGFPPSPGPLGPAGLGPLPAPELSLHRVVRLWILVGLAVRVGSVGVGCRCPPRLPRGCR